MPGKKLIQYSFNRFMMPAMGPDTYVSATLPTQDNSISMIAYPHGSICGSLVMSVHAYWVVHGFDCIGQCQCLDNADGLGL